MATIGTLAVNLIAKTSAFDAGLKKGTNSLKGFVGQIANTQRMMVNFARGVIAAAGVAGLGYMVKRTMDSIDATAKLSDRLQMATEDLVALQHAARISGIDTEGMNKALETFVRRVGEVKNGGGQAGDTLRKLGLSANQLSNNNQIDNLKLLADRINQLPTAADKAAVAYDLFGRQGQQMLNLLAEGSKGIEAYRKEAERLGITFSRFDAAKVEAANDAITRAKEKLSGFVQVATIALAPTIDAIATKIANIGTSAENMGRGMTEGIKGATMAFAVAGDVLSVIKGIAQGIFGVISTAVTGTGAVIAGIMHIVEAAYNKIVDLQNKLSETKIGEKLGIGKWSHADITSGIDSFVEQSGKLTADSFKSAEKSITDLSTSKVDQWFADLAKQSEGIKNSLEEAARAKENFADTKPLIDEKSVLESTKNVIESIRSQHYLTRMERIEALKEYARVNADTLQQVAEANKTLNEEITNLEKSRVSQLKVYMAELRENMQEFDLFVSDKMAEAAKSIEDSMSNAFYGIMAEGQTFKETMISFAMEIRNAYMRMLADILAKATMSATTNMMGSLIGTVIGGAFGGLFMGGTAMGGAASMSEGGFQGMTTPTYQGTMYAHSGGIAGRISRSRIMPDYLFTGAPRLHSGLMSDEFPAILERGERVVSKVDVAREKKMATDNASGEQPNVNLKIINVTDKKQLLEFLGTSDGERVVINTLKRNKGIIAGMLR